MPAVPSGIGAAAQDDDEDDDGGGAWQEMDDAQRAAGLEASTAPSKITAPETEIETAAAGTAGDGVAGLNAGGVINAELMQGAHEMMGEADMEVQSCQPLKPNAKPPKTEGNAARRAAAAAEYERLAKRGAPPGTRFAPLPCCHLSQQTLQTLQHILLSAGLDKHPGSFNPKSSAFSMI